MKPGASDDRSAGQRITWEQVIRIRNKDKDHTLSFTNTNFSEWEPINHIIYLILHQRGLRASPVYFLSP